VGTSAHSPADTKVPGFSVHPRPPSRSTRTPPCTRPSRQLPESPSPSKRPDPASPTAPPCTAPPRTRSPCSRCSPPLAGSPGRGFCCGSISISDLPRVDLAQFVVHLPDFLAAFDPGEQANVEALGAEGVNHLRQSRKLGATPVPLGCAAGLLRCQHPLQLVQRVQCLCRCFRHSPREPPRSRIACSPAATSSTRARRAAPAVASGSAP